MNRVEIDLNQFAKDFAEFVNISHGIHATVNLVQFTDENWNQVMAATGPYRADQEQQDLRLGMTLAIKQPVRDEEIPDAIQVLLPSLAEAMRTSDVVVALNMDELVRNKLAATGDVNKTLNELVNSIIIMYEKGLTLLGHKNLNPVADQKAFLEQLGDDGYSRYIT